MDVPVGVLNNKEMISEILLIIQVKIICLNNASLIHHNNKTCKKFVMEAVKKEQWIALLI